MTYPMEVVAIPSKQQMVGATDGTEDTRRSGPETYARGEGTAGLYRRM
jgi:hypothetical protein